jgi:hypothetical protein
MNKSWLGVLIGLVLVLASMSQAGALWCKKDPGVQFTYTDAAGLHVLNTHVTLELQGSGLSSPLELRVEYPVGWSARLTQPSGDPIPTDVVFVAADTDYVTYRLTAGQSGVSVQDDLRMSVDAPSAGISVSAEYAAAANALVAEFSAVTDMSYHDLTSTWSTSPPPAPMPIVPLAGTYTCTPSDFANGCRG